jgi:hypothetical protein
MCLSKHFGEDSARPVRRKSACALGRTDNIARPLDRLSNVGLRWLIVANTTTRYSQKLLGQAGATHVRPANAGDNAFIPARGRMTFDTADLEQMEQRGTLNDVITHEMGHVIGVSGLIWGFKGLLNGAGTENPTFEGRSAMEEYGRLRGDGSEPTPVPVENEGGPGTAGSHWREKVFRNELMSGFIAAAGNPISRVTVGSLRDMGYVVDMDAAEPYDLPNLLRMAEEGLLVSHEAPIDVGIMLPTIPEVVPEDSLQ